MKLAEFKCSPVACWVALQKFVYKMDEFIFKDEDFFLSFSFLEIKSLFIFQLQLTYIIISVKLPGYTPLIR